MEDLTQTKLRRNGGKVEYEPYAVEKLERIKKLIETFEQKGNRKRYMILVDGEMVVPITHEAESFDDYLDFMDVNTNIVEVRTFFKDSPNCNRYIFYLKENPQHLNGPQELSDPQSQIQQALEKQQLETRIMLLELDLKRKRKKLKNYKALQAQLDDKQIDIKDLLVKGIELYGHIKGGPPGAPVQGLPPAEVEIEREQSPSDRHYAQLKEQYGEKHLERALKLWELFILHPDLREDFTQLITIKKQQHGEA